MTLGLPIVPHGNVGTVANSVIINCVSIESTSHSSSAVVHLFKGVGGLGVANKIGAVVLPGGDATVFQYFGYEGLLAQDGFQCVTSGNVSWSGVGYRHYSG